MHFTRSFFLGRARGVASLVAFVAASACTESTPDNFTNPPPGPPASCTAVPSLAGCVAGSVSYSCAGGRPDDGDTNLVCDDGTPGIGDDAGGATLYCCAPYAQWASVCAPATVAGCGAESIGFACSGGTSPDQADTSLVCSAPLTGDAGTRDFCCVPFSQTSGACRCASYDSSSAMCGVNGSGCAGAAIGIACAAGHAPTEVNPALDCATPDGGGAGSYCCQTP